MINTIINNIKVQFPLLKATTLATIIIVFYASGSISYAQGPSDEEVFNGMVELNITANRIISYDAGDPVSNITETESKEDQTETESPDVNQAYSYVRPTIVQIHSNGFYGSGTIYSIEKDYITIISNKHVLEDWNKGTNNYVIFYDGAVTNAELIGLSDNTDLGMIRVDTSELMYEELIHYRSINYDESVYDSLVTDDTVFTIGSDMLIKNTVEDDKVSIYGINSGIGSSLYSGVLVNSDIYVTNLDRNMIYCYCYAQPGMSGGGIFDGYGHYLGMLTGGTSDDEAVAVRLPDVLAAIEEIMQ
ncbi:MAG: trypsin-like peptidase domain-containing protein [Butyrivibrio sp.]|nr:trypsin-like peptidase domain-containing protein [Butyrivibrio sp.]